MKVVESGSVLVRQIDRAPVRYAKGAAGFAGRKQAGLSAAYVQDSVLRDSQNTIMLHADAVLVCRPSSHLGTDDRQLSVHVVRRLDRQIAYRINTGLIRPDLGVPL